MRTRRRHEVRSIRTPLRTGGWAQTAVHCDFVGETMYAGGSSGSLRHSSPPPTGVAALLGGRGARRDHLHLCRRRLRRRRVLLRLCVTRGLQGCAPARSPALNPRANCPESRVCARLVARSVWAGDAARERAAGRAVGRAAGDLPPRLPPEASVGSRLTRRCDPARRPRPGSRRFTSCPGPRRCI